MTGRVDSPRIALMWRAEPGEPPPRPEDTRQRLIFEALVQLGAAAEPVLYADEEANAVRDRLMGFDGVLVWVNPISDAGDRSSLDPMLREVAASGVAVSAHPDVILKMGVKDVLYTTRTLGWGTDTHRYDSMATLRRAFPERLASGARVLKRNRGNAGMGVWKVELVEATPGVPGPDAAVRILEARRGSVPQTMRLDAFLERCALYLEHDCVVLDQPFQPRLPEGMIRCYMSEARVAGFGHQLIKALLPPPPEGPESPEAQPGPRIMHPPTQFEFNRLRTLMEETWVPGMQQLLDIEREALPALWDADFLYGPRDAAGEDSYVLCEINASSVAPFPDSAARPVAEIAARRAVAALSRCQGGNAARGRWESSSGTSLRPPHSDPWSRDKRK